jgi:hypothetical protein
LDPPDWSLNRVSGNVGCRSHGTIVQAGGDLIFLSETGRGVYALSQAPSSEQEGVWVPLSKDIQGYIDRINWAACDQARATYWHDLYILSVPLDGYTYNNFMLVYSISLQRWQGLWTFSINNQNTGGRDFARDRTDPNKTALLLITSDGIISRFSDWILRQYFDQNIDLSHQLYNSTITTRAFTFNEDVNQIRPHSGRFQFLDSVDPVNITALADRKVQVANRTFQTTGYLLSLTIPGFPFDLDTGGFVIQVMGLLKTGICHELQFQLQGTGNWTLYQIKAAAFESVPLLAT